jgi:biopolymer transport protein TolQ
MALGHGAILAEEVMEGKLSILKIILEGGPVVKLVLLLLVAASVASWAIVWKKKQAYSAMNESDEEFLKIYNGDIPLAEVLEKTKNMEFSTLRTVFAAGQVELQKMKSLSENDNLHKLRTHFSQYGLTSIERALKKGVNESNTELDSLLTVLASIGSISPFIGLFGTVWGIIDAFSGLSTGGGSLDAVAPGIAEALVATAIGLAAAIPAVWFYNIFSKENAQYNSQMENFGQDFLNAVERSLLKG